jgi:hypothetical protein
MKIENCTEGRNLLRRTISSFYEANGSRHLYCFRVDKKDELDWHEEHCLLDKKHVFIYSIGSERGIAIGGIALAIGPHYFTPANFWDYENAKRFSIESSTEAVEKNLRLLDEFLGYRVKT